MKEEYSLEVPAFYAFMQALVQRGCPLDITKINTVSDLAKMVKNPRSKQSEKYLLRRYMPADSFMHKADPRINFWFSRIYGFNLPKVC